MRRSLREWFSIRLAKNPGQIVLLAILLFNVGFLLLAAFLISRMSLTGTEQLGFLEAAYYTVTMILDAGCVSFVVEDIGPQNAIIAIVCLFVIVIGMISFTGAVIGYITNYISGFIEDSNAGNHRLVISNHFVILNWNSRALEIVNDLLYSDSYNKIVVLVGSGREDVERQIDERINETVKKENRVILERSRQMPYLAGKLYYRRNRFRNNLTIIVREGDIFSSKQLNDISLYKAASVIILGDEMSDVTCKYQLNDRAERYGSGNFMTVKALMQVSDITSASFSEDNQRIIVEITDDWTWNLVQKIIRSKQVDGKCNIVPIRVNQILGQLMSQFSLMPELNTVYNELLSNKGAAFFSAPSDSDDETSFIENSLKTNDKIIPLTVRSDNNKTYSYYMALEQDALTGGNALSSSGNEISVKINKNYWLEKKKIVILGHNSKCHELMEGFSSFVNEWGYKDSNENLLSIVVIDDKKNLEKMDNYKDYPFVIKTVAAELFEKDIICNAINEFLDMNDEDVSVLILSDDQVSSDETDAGMLANLVYVQDIINDKVESNPDFDTGSIDVIAEINDPKHYDVVSSYSVKNVVISNRYISKMITQIGEKDAIFDFYQDILVYDSDGTDEYDSKELYIKKVKDFFDELPPECTADKLIRAVCSATYDPSKPKEHQNINVVLGYVDKDSKVVLFGGDQTKISVKLGMQDKLIVFSNH